MNIVYQYESQTILDSSVYDMYWNQQVSIYCHIPHNLAFLKGGCSSHFIVSYRYCSCFITCNAVFAQFGSIFGEDHYFANILDIVRVLKGSSQ